MFDFIGDIHGHADELQLLLELLGYDRRRGHYSHPTRQAFFLGDLIDRGPRIRDTLAIVRSMVDAGAARMVLGNHEYNALAYHTRDPDRPDEFLRPHELKNVKQHRQTLMQLPAAELYEYLQWFRTLPLWFQRDDVRAIHACWDDARLATLAAACEQHGGLTDEFLVAAARREDKLYWALDELLKGKDIPLPRGMSYSDKDGHERHHMRIKWYASPSHHTYRSYALTSDPGLPDEPLPDSFAQQVAPYPIDARPVFVGHYWLRGDRPRILARNVACLDYSVAKSGLLVAYRWDGESVLSDEKFLWVEAK